MPLLSFSPLKLYHLSGNIFRKWFASYFLFNINMISEGKSYCCNDTFTDRFTLLPAKMLKKNTNYFYAVRISISLAVLSEIFIPIGYFF